jgi:hypothetical protein
MDRKDFKLRLKNIGISQKKFAILTGYGYSTVKSWDTIPKWVDIVLSYMEAFHKLQKIDKSLHMLDGIREELNVLEMNIYK